MNISLYTSTCKREHRKPMKNMNYMKNPQAGDVICRRRVFHVFHVFHVSHAFPKHVCGVGIELGASPCAEAMTTFTGSFV